MRNAFFVIAITGVLLTLNMSRASGEGGQVLGLAPDVGVLELYKSHKDEDVAVTLSAGQLSFPAPILAESDNGMYKINQNGAEYWVITDDVTASVTRKIESSCEPKMAGTIVAHGKRGTGKDCK